MSLLRGSPLAEVPETARHTTHVDHPFTSSPKGGERDMTPKMIEQYAALHDMTIPEAIKYIEHEMIYREKRKSPTGIGTQGNISYDTF